MNSDTTEISINKVKQSRLQELDPDNIIFGRVFSDHMFVADFRDGQWTDARIVPYENISLSPATSALHYGQSIFEGMKAYRTTNNEVVLFRPFDNHKRFNISSVRMAMPEIPEELFMEGLNELIKLDKDWVLKGEDSSLYIRPFCFATDDYIGVKPSETYRFMIFTSPVQKYYTEPVRVHVETRYIRAVEGGVGYVKVSGNYGRSLYPARLAQQKGYHQVIWTDAREHRFLEESGTMNLMFIINDKLVTPPLGDTILAGITRDSVIKLAKKWGTEVEERRISIDELIRSFEEGKLGDMFGAGTAATIAPIELFGFEGKDYRLKPASERPFSNRMFKELTDIKKGRQVDPFNWIHKIE